MFHNSVALIRERTAPTELLPSCRRSQFQLLRLEGCHVVIVTDPYGRILGFLDRAFCLQSVYTTIIHKVPGPSL
jgi:hypothetical protein